MDSHNDPRWSHGGRNLCDLFLDTLATYDEEDTQSRDQLSVRIEALVSI